MESQYELLYPGMPVRYSYYDDDQVKYVDGVLHQVETYINRTDRNNPNFNEISVLKLFVDAGLS